MKKIHLPSLTFLRPAKPNFKDSVVHLYNDIRKNEQRFERFCADTEKKFKEKDAEIAELIAQVQEKDIRISNLEALTVSLKTKNPPKKKIQHPQEAIDCVRGKSFQLEYFICDLQF